MQENTYEAVIASRIGDAKKTAESCMLFISKNISNPSEGDMYDIRLVLSELLYNAVIHGNNSDESKIVRVSVKINQNRLCVKICDEGKGFDYSTVLNKNEHQESGSLMLENGRGILLAKALVDEISFNKKGNIIKFSKRMATNG